MKTNPSREQLSKSLDRRVKHLMVRTLERFEYYFDETQESQVFKGDIRTMFNDVLRAQRDELLDYQVEYRPLRLTDSNTLAITQTFMQSVQKIEFLLNDGVPNFLIWSSLDKVNVLESLRSEFEAGVVFVNEESAAFLVVGVEACINFVIPIMDKYKLHSDVRQKYQEWRKKVITLYRSKV